jgi:hypothetical protein
MRGNLAGFTRVIMTMHKPIVLERTDWRITKAACSCGTPLPLGFDSYSLKKQSEKVIAAFQAHKVERQSARTKQVGPRV